MAELNKEETDILDSVNNGEWRSIEDKEKKSARYRIYARETLPKDRRVNVRLSGRILRLFRSAR